MTRAPRFSDESRAKRNHLSSVHSRPGPRRSHKRVIARDLLRACEERWRISVGEQVASHASLVYVCRDETGVSRILKIARPELHPDREAASLLAWNGSGAPRLLAHALELGALLLERIAPGTPLQPGDDERAARFVADVLKRLHSVDAPVGIPSQSAAYEEWRDRVRVNAEPDSAGIGLLDAASAAFERLDASTTRHLFLHGDFIDKNLLRGEDGYVAIDPIPRTGDPCSDVGFYAAYHPPAHTIARRARTVATAAGLDTERAARWAAVWAVGEATETWRRDSDELAKWVKGGEARTLLTA